ncbi:MAG TPA: thioredoxin domain-containing protein [Acetobacteraceae bacterium]|jgi:protein-disulfide isomerase|nr:thioredoxin domain-containing protein [Acetobacteraceae bacterium]
MLTSRRTLMVGGGLAAAALLAGPAHADDALAQQMAPRALGKPDAPVQVMEWFSLTCPHCARFAKETLPEVEKQFIDPGKLYYVFKDFPLDQVALTAAMVARTLPPPQYVPFCTALLASQDRWAFARDVNSTQELAKIAALAGMSRATFNQAISNDALRTAILKEQDVGVKTYNVDSTPYFIFNGPGAKNRKEAGEMSYDTFARVVAGAAGA